MAQRSKNELTSHTRNTYHSCKSRPTQSECIRKRSVWDSPKRFTTGHNTIRLSLPSNQQESTKYQTEEKVDEQKRHKDSSEASLECIINVAIEEGGWSVDVVVDFIGVAEVIDKVHVMLVKPVEEFASLENDGMLFG